MDIFVYSLSQYCCSLVLSDKLQTKTSVQCTFDASSLVHFYITMIQRSDHWFKENTFQFGTGNTKHLQTLSMFRPSFSPKSLHITATENTFVHVTDAYPSDLLHICTLLHEVCYCCNSVLLCPVDVQRQTWTPFLSKPEQKCFPFNSVPQIRLMFKQKRNPNSTKSHTPTYHLRIQVIWG